MIERMLTVRNKQTQYDLRNLKRIKSMQRKKRVTTPRLSPLEISLLAILLNGGGKRAFSIDELEQRVYRNIGKALPRTLRQATSSLIRSTSMKLMMFHKAKIERLSSLGRGNLAEYMLIGDIKSVRMAMNKSLEEYNG